MLDMLVGSINANFWYLFLWHLSWADVWVFILFYIKVLGPYKLEGINSIFWKWLFNSHSIILICECANDWCILGMEEDSENSWGIWC